MSTYYPLRAGNSWTYKMNNGNTFTNRIEKESGGVYSMSNSTVSHLTQVKKDGPIFYTDSYETGNMQPFLKDDVVVGDKWDIRYRANSIDSVLNIAVTSAGGSKEVGGKTYADVMEMEGVMSFVINGNVINAGTKYNWYYAKGVGLILTTSTLGENMPLESCTVQ
ncbi:MAG TPA: hypothetical protein PLD84_16280 [Chitinophagales bacterium]|nr:hypothetical protein [Chitinophagales bacterium]